jgi:hypothetical protein
MSETAELLTTVNSFIRRYVVLSSDQLTAVALWTLHTHAFEAAETTPYLAVTSAEKRSGKTRLLEVLELLVREPLPTSNISDAALFRAIAELKPTLLLDEVDAIFGPKARDREDLRAMLNAGYRFGAMARRMGGPRMTTLEAFPVFCAKAFAGIGELPDTISDRAIRIRLDRRVREEPIERFRRREAQEAAEPIWQSLVAWGGHHVDRLAYARPELPDELDDRAQDGWETLLAIADIAGDDWSARARGAAIALSGPEARQEENDSLSARLLADIHTVFSANGAQRYKTADLISELCEIEESPWGDWYGRTLTPQALSKLLRPFQIRTMPVRAEGKVVKGYKAEQFSDAFHRVLGVTRVTPVTTEATSEAGSNPRNPCNSQGTGETPLAGDSGFPDHVDGALHEGHLTEAEWLERRKVHALLEAAA